MSLAAKAPEERRRRILDAAVAVLRQRGFGGARVADIAAVAETSPALVLYHFSSLGNLLVAALDAVDENYYQRLLQCPTDSAVERFVRMADLATEEGPAFGDWQLWLEVWARSMHDERIDTLRRRADQRWRDAIADTLELGAKEQLFQVVDPVRTTLRIAALMDGLAVQAVLGGSVLSGDLRAVDLAREWLCGVASETGLEPAHLLSRLEQLR